MSPRDVGQTRRYRERVYESYVTAFKGYDAPDVLRAAYARHARFFDHLFGPLLDGPIGDVLEIGCGPGTFLFWATARGAASVRGVDISDEQVGVARSLDLPAEVASFQSYLPVCRDRFDLVVALDVIEHLTRDEAFELLDLSLAALRPGGLLVLTTPNGRALRPGPVWYGDLTHETLFSPKTITLALRLAGYEAIRVAEITPPSTTVRSTVRRLLWFLVRLFPMAIDLVETGTAGERVYSRNMVVVAQRPRDHGV
jgi:2-polyprenyl-3-methyl-5-hydroxy-6-metoxy-1,4-benzoquinol methylase